MFENYYAVIMAGGGGTRLWPLSRRHRPKQMLRLGGERTLYQMAIDRLNGLFPPERIFIVTVLEQAADLQAQCPQIPTDNFLLEPIPRGTASVVGLASIALRHRDPQATMAVLTADHYIENVSYFRDLLRSAFFVAQDDYLVTLGIQPSFPSTGYGYIQRGEKIGEYDNFLAYHVIRFREKPNKKRAKEMVEQGDHEWNSGMFIWRVERIYEEITWLMPELIEKLEQINQSWGSQERSSVLNSVWPTINPQTIDYGIMEKASQVSIIRAVDLGWNDVGSWDSLFDVLPKDEDGNIILDAQHITLGTESSLICSSDKDRLIVTIGAKDLIVIDTRDALLVCSRREAQKVRQLVNYLKETGQDEYI